MNARAKAAIMTYADSQYDITTYMLAANAALYSQTQKCHYPQ